MKSPFQQRLQKRKEMDETLFSDAFQSISEVILGKRVFNAMHETERLTAVSAIEGILRYYGITPGETPENLKTLEEQLEFHMRPAGIMQRRVGLKDAWYREATGAFLGFDLQNRPVALLPHGSRGYCYYDFNQGKEVKLNPKTAKNLKPEAISFYRPLPLRKIGTKDLLLFIVRNFSSVDLFRIVLITFFATAVSIIPPFLTGYAYSHMVHSTEYSPLIWLMAFFVGCSLSITMLNITKSMLIARLETKTDVAVQSAVIMRLLQLPIAFFKQYSAGELSQRAQAIDSLCTAIVTTGFSAGLSAVMSLIYFLQIYSLAPVLTVPSLLIMLGLLGLSIVTMFVQSKVTYKQLEASSKESGLLFSLLKGLQKIKLTASERRAYAKWTALYKKSAMLAYQSHGVIVLQPVFALIISLAGTLVLYAEARTAMIPADRYMAFSASFALLSASFVSLCNATMSAASIRPILQIVRPILESVPETSAGMRMVTSLDGDISLSHIDFRYSSSMPLVLSDFSLHVRAGEYVAIVGKSGSGKSTLLRLLLGFEQPEKGAVYYDEMDIKLLNVQSLRQKIGCVMQDETLFPGTIFNNIAISSPFLTEEEAWLAAEMAGVAEDIRQMPMGMRTFISEGTSVVSGGQRQRIIIARAIASKPSILIFDEATSALDNVTQKIVSDSLETLHCTRIVVAHRLSTIRNADRIVMLDQGKIVEEGTYDELVKKDGQFAKLVRRQQISL